MKKVGIWLKYLLVLIMLGCNKNPDPELPGYLVMPSSLSNYKGSGRLFITGGLTLVAEGQERVQTGGKISGVLASAAFSNEVLINATFGQPRIYAESSIVPSEFRSNGELRISNTIKVGSYPMGIKMQPTPKGEFADLTLNLPGSLIFISQEGSVTIEASTLIRQERSYSLYRIRGTFDSNMHSDDSGATNRDPHVTGTFDVLAVAN